jgi:hypothetical protein
MSDQLQLLDDDAGRRVTWLTPVDRHGRALPEIVVIGSTWNAPFKWAHLAVEAANELPDNAPLERVYAASCETRHLYYALTGNRRALRLELEHYGVEVPDGL